MKVLKYTIIKNRKQYNEYCNILNDLIFDTEIEKSDAIEDEIELLTLLIEKWDKENGSNTDQDPVELIKGLMKEHKLKSKDLAKITGLSTGMISSILNYRKGLSKNSIRILSEYFKLSQSAFNRPYALRNVVNTNFKNSSLMNSPK